MRIKYCGAFHHIMSRGNGKQKIFFDDHDRAFFISVLSDIVTEHSWICHGYCLMENHYHLLLETPELTLSTGMQALNGTYAQKFNWRHSFVGHVMQGRYKSPLVKNDGHLLEIVRYIVLNPVRGGLVEEPQQWKWSSYRATAGLTGAPAFLRTGLILGMFSDGIEEAREKYTVFVSQGSTEPDTAIPDGRTPLDHIFREAIDRPSRKRAILVAYSEHGYSSTEIASYLGIDRSNVCRALNHSRVDV